MIVSRRAAVRRRLKIRLGEHQRALREVEGRQFLAFGPIVLAVAPVGLVETPGRAISASLQISEVEVVGFDPGQARQVALIAAAG